MARMFQPVRSAGPSDNKKTSPKEKKDGKQGEAKEKAPKTGQKGRHG